MLIKNRKFQIIVGLSALLLAGGFLAKRVGFFTCFQLSNAVASDEYQGPEKLDSSATWQCTMKGKCSGEGLCCPHGMKKHLKDVKGIRDINVVDQKGGIVQLKIEDSKTIEVKDIKAALGTHWMLKKIEKAPE